MLPQPHSRTITAGNLAHVLRLSKLDCATEHGRAVKKALPVAAVPEKESWRPGLLDALLRERGVREKGARDAKGVNAMIASLCYT